MARIGCAVLLALVLAIPVVAQTADPASAVFLLVTYDHEPEKDGQFHGHTFGTGFFISPDGTALTASHVAYAAAHFPDKYRLIAVVGQEFYDATVVCSSRLPYDPMRPDTNHAGVPSSRDVAEVKVGPTTAFEGRKNELYLLPKNGPRLTWATAHTGPIPEFPTLAVGGKPKYDEQVKVIGFGLISAIPERWTSEGQITKDWTGQDGTPLFDITSSNPAQPGDSGSPVLDDQNQVVGIWAWHYYLKPTVGTMEGNVAFEKPCP